MEPAAAEKICGCFFYLQTAIDDEATDSALCALADLLCLEKWGNHSSRLLEQMLLFTPSR
ncbi:hypothetical protein [Enterococcus casseliflavus]|uniref:hypothetical protein n=1 Tax=Enterococcus casseliflavus TaxID=37734 RepID=UPI0022E8F6DB|nr:hypothetical protein [Enterococcus casseliflavus]